MIRHPFVTSYLYFSQENCEELSEQLESIATFVESHVNDNDKIVYISGVLYDSGDYNSFYRLEEWISKLIFSEQFSIAVAWNEQSKLLESTFEYFPAEDKDEEEK